jgi:hypothetical protein
LTKKKTNGTPFENGLYEPMRYAQGCDAGTEKAQYGEYVGEGVVDVQRPSFCSLAYNSAEEDFFHKTSDAKFWRFALKNCC